MKIAMAQVNPTVGDLEGNVEIVKKYIRKAREKGAELVAFPEMTITGYPPQDLLYEYGFVRENKRFLQELFEESKNIAAVVGFVDYDPTRKGSDGTEVKYNAAAVIMRSMKNHIKLVRAHFTEKKGDFAGDISRKSGILY